MQTQAFLPPEELLTDIKLPDRTHIATVGDMARVILEDEEVILLKNADLKVLREYRRKLGERDERHTERH